MNQRCSHGKTWKEECPDCEKILWENVTKPLIKELASDHQWDRDGERCRGY